MDGVLTRTHTGRPRAAAVGAILILCLVAAPLMSLFPVALWEVTRGLVLDGLGLEAMLIAPVAVSGMLLMFLAGASWLRWARVTHPASCAALVTGTALATPVVMGFLAPALRPFPGGLYVNSAVVSALAATVAMGVCVLFSRRAGRRQPGVLPGVAVAAAALLVLPLASEHMRDRSTEQRSLAQIQDFDYPIAVLDHPSWVPVRVHEVHGGLRITYTSGQDLDDPDGTGDPGTSGPGAAPANGDDILPALPAPVAAGAAGPGVGSENPEEVRPGTLHVLSWTPDRTAEGIRSGCDFPGVECSEADSFVVVHRGMGGQAGARLSEVRAQLGDDIIASVHPVGAVSPELLFAVAQTLRVERPGERGLLAESILHG
ncbi:hypothetical protein NE857_06815 [Nocardiopsis exhalans]|uniref:Uncharacterized protein n=1 Tax=Nocardiopsis exhalans TaxID=163604 RepID=A0ABY5DD65_9ACTN|nr:hypothetical protein [Nocardiopsis exhalans]USY21325.1 hypothetical protein NE857_06815 [Nocardiopsis exhalans]